LAEWAKRGIISVESMPFLASARWRKPHNPGMHAVGAKGNHRSSLEQWRLEWESTNQMFDL
jgi:hypothetical protein